MADTTGRRRLDSAFLSEIVSRIVEHNNAGRRGTRLVAAEMGVPVRTVEWWLERAYATGVAVSPGRGRALGWPRVRCEHCNGAGYVEAVSRP